MKKYNKIQDIVNLYLKTCQQTSFSNQIKGAFIIVKYIKHMIYQSNM